MTMPPCGTFHYCVTLPGESVDSSVSLQLQLGQLIEPTGDPLNDNRLLGYSPTLLITDAGPAPSERHPAIRRCRFSLTAAADKEGCSASFYIDRELPRNFVAGDTLHLARTSCGGLGLSLLRGEQLVLAVGAISSVPLGEDFRTISPLEWVHKIESLFQNSDPTFELYNYPVQLDAYGETRIRFGGITHLGKYEVCVLHGFRVGCPGTDECVGIALKGTCGPAPIARSARWLEDELEMQF
jgi:hypothetical protein